MKYIVFDVSASDEGEFELKLPIIFPEHMIHRFVASGLIIQLRLQYKRVRMASAGDFDPMTGKCSGHSETLNLKCDNHDSLLINSYGLTHGIVA